MKEMKSVLSLYHRWAVETLNYNGLGQMVLISILWNFEVWNMSWDFRLRIPLWGSFVFKWCVAFNRWCCSFIQYNLLKGCCKWILIQHWIQVLEYSLPGLTWDIRLRIRISHLSIFGIVVHGRSYVSHCFYFLFFCFFWGVFFSVLLLWLFVGWSLFFAFVFISLDSSFRNKESVLTCLLSF